MDLEFMLLDTFDSIRNKNFPKVETLEESNTVVRRIRQAEANLLRIGSSQDSSSNLAGMETVQDIIQSYA